MKKTILILCVFALASCATPKGTVDGITYENGRAIVTGTFTVTAPTQAQIDSTIQVNLKDVFSYQLIFDSANVHKFGWKFISPQIK